MKAILDLQALSGKRAGTACALVCAAMLLSACEAAPRLQPRIAKFDWQFTPIISKPADKDATFAKCDRAARDRVRFVTDYEDQVSRYTLATIACMRIEGWGITKPPMQFVPHTPSAAALAASTAE